MRKETYRSGVTIAIIITAGVVGFIIFAGWLGSAAGSTHEHAEYEIKAAFLLHFIKYVEWPDDREGATGKELVLCVAGENPFGDVLDLMQGKTIRGRPIVIKTEVDHATISGCHLLFIPASEKGRIRSLLKKVDGLPVLTVSETEDFILQGGIINFTITDNKVRFEINPDAAKRLDLQISAQLLKLAQIVTDL